MGGGLQPARRGHPVREQHHPHAPSRRAVLRPLRPVQHRRVGGYDTGEPRAPHVDGALPGLQLQHGAVGQAEVDHPSRHLRGSPVEPGRDGRRPGAGPVGIGRPFPQGGAPSGAGGPVARPALPRPLHGSRGGAPGAEADPGQGLHRAHRPPPHLQCHPLGRVVFLPEPAFRIRPGGLWRGGRCGVRHFRPSGSGARWRRSRGPRGASPRTGGSWSPSPHP